MTPLDLIWIDDAAREYNRARDWLYRQIREGRLQGYKFAGDRKMYLSRKELDDYLRTPRPVNE